MIFLLPLIRQIFYLQEMKKMHGVVFRIKIAWGILFGKHQHFILVSYTKKEFVNVLSGCSSNYQKVICDMPEFIFYKAIKKIASEKNDTDLVIEKASFEAEYFEDNIAEK